MTDYNNLEFTNTIRFNNPETFYILGNIPTENCFDEFSIKLGEKYETILNDKFIKFKNIIVNEVDPKAKIDECYVSYKKAFVEAHNEVTDILYRDTNRSVQKKWWTHDMSKLKKVAIKARLDQKLCRNEETTMNVKTAKKNFRRQQRKCVYEYEQKKNIDIENFFDIPSKEEFRKSLDMFEKNKEILINNENKKTSEEIFRHLFKLNAANQNKYKLITNEKKFIGRHYITNSKTYSSYQQQQQQDQDNNNQLIISNKNTFQTQQPLQWIELEIKGNVKNISPKLWQWTHLKYLYLNDNNLMRLPPVIANLTQLQLLDASNNKIRTLPSEIGDMASLRELYLNNNFIRVLPYELGKLFKLQALGIKGNPLTQDITSIYSEVNGTQKLLVHLLDQLTCTCPPPVRRPWILLSQPQDSGNTCIFTTMCYNVLCDKYATRNFYGYCPPWALSWEYRKKAILEDIKIYNADIITLQELETEYFHNYFLPELRPFEYEAIFSPKSRAKTMSEQDKKHVDGCGVFYKTSRFTLLKDYLVEFNQIAMQTAEGSEDMLNRVMTKDNIGVAALLETKQEEPYLSSSNGQNQPNNKQLILVFTAHIHWDPEYCDVKLIQTLMLTNELKRIVEQAMREFRPHVQNPDCNSIPVVICADLNSTPDSGVIEYLRSGKISANHMDFKELGYDSCLQKINTSEKTSELSHNFRLECAYEKDTLPFTNYTYDFKGMIDYIFFSRNSMRALGLLGPLDLDWIKTNKIIGFPHPHVPSDHLPLIVELELFSQPIPDSNLQLQQHQQQQQQIMAFNRPPQPIQTSQSISLGQMIPINTNSPTSAPALSSSASTGNNNNNNFNYNNYLHQNSRK